MDIYTAITGRYSGGELVETIVTEFPTMSRAIGSIITKSIKMGQVYRGPLGHGVLVATTDARGYVFPTSDTSLVERDSIDGANH